MSASKAADTTRDYVDHLADIAIFADETGGTLDIAWSFFIPRSFVCRVAQHLDRVTPRSLGYRTKAPPVRKRQLQA